MAEGKDDLVPVWLFAPTGQDAKLLRSGLARGDGLRIAATTQDLSRALEEPGQVGVLVMTQEALSAETMSALRRYVENQPPWAELPMVLLVDPKTNTMSELERFQSALPRTKVLVLQRPVRLSELGTAVEAMRRSRRRQHDLRSYVERQEQLRRELNHRVKNILATVQALYGLTFRMASDLDGFNAVFQPRLAAMARVHEVLFAADYGDVDLARLASAVLSPYAGDDRVTAEGPRVSIPAEMGQSLGLIVHELATNAAKHGALTSEAGQVRLRWTQGECLRMTWAEEDGPALAPPTRKGYGVAFIEATIRALGGRAEFDYSSTGLKFEASMPTPEASGRMVR